MMKNTILFLTLIVCSIGVGLIAHYFPIIAMFVFGWTVGGWYADYIHLRLDQWLEDKGL